MRLFFAIFFPWLSFFLIGRPFAGLFCLALQITILGWIPAAIWAVYSLGQYKSEKRLQEELDKRFSKMEGR